MEAPSHEHSDNRMSVGPVYRCMTAFRVHRIRAIFEEHDVDKSGCLDLREAKQCLFKLQASDYIHLSCCTCMSCDLHVSDDNRSACNLFPLLLSLLFLTGASQNARRSDAEP